MARNAGAPPREERAEPSRAEIGTLDIARWDRCNPF